MMSKRAVLVAVVVAAAGLAACGKKFMCDLNGTSCPKGSVAPGTASVDHGAKCGDALCTAGYCSQDSDICTPYKKDGARCESSAECEGKCAQDRCE